VYFLILFLFFPSLEKELNYLIEDTIDYVNGEKTDTSVGHRGELYKAAFKIIKANPLGIGEDNFYSYKKVLIDNNEISPSVGHHLNAHSEVMSSTIEQGILGLISYLLVLFIPGIYFYKRFIEHNSDASLLGLLIVLNYFFFSITSVIFAHQSTVLFFTFMIVIMYAFTENRKLHN